jgi:hypothetical protein
MCSLKHKFEEWEAWLFGDDVHSIRRQIHNMIWDSAVFLSINKARSYAPVDEKGNVELNGTVHQFINVCFFRTQAIAIRRLLDKETNPGKYSVISLYRLIDDIEKHCHLLTRANILAAHSYPYNYEQEEEAFLQKMSRGKSDNKTHQGLINCVHSETMHEYIDSLSGVTSSQRNPNDSGKKEIFEWLKKRLSKCEKIYDYVNKFLAHSSTPESRAIISADEIKITLGEILDAHKIICEIAEFIGLKILYQSFGNFLAIPQFDHFEHFEKPWASEETVKKVRKFWEDYDKETRQWKAWDWQSEFNQCS